MRVYFLLQRTLPAVGVAVPGCCAPCSCSGQCSHKSLLLGIPTHWPPARGERERIARDVFIISDQKWWPTFLLTQNSVPSLEGKQVWCMYYLFAIANMYVNMLHSVYSTFYMYNIVDLFGHYVLTSFCYLYHRCFMVLQFIFLIKHFTYYQFSWVSAIFY